MKGRQKGRPTKWVQAQINESIAVGKTGLTFEVWGKWKKTGKKLGTLTVSVGGLRWWPNKVRRKNDRQRTWDEVSDWFEN